VYELIVDQTRFDEVCKVLGALGAIATFLWTVYIWRDKSLKELEASKAESERASLTRRIEATKPFLERQLELYTVATRSAAIIATSHDQDEVQNATGHFLRLFSGELALVENLEVASAMQDFRRALGKNASRSRSVKEMPQGRAETPEMEKEALVQLSLKLAAACRNSLARSWGIRAWASPDEATQELDNKKDERKPKSTDNWLRHN
jgi:hypothetical protein